MLFFEEYGLTGAILRKICKNYFWLPHKLLGNPFCLHNLFFGYAKNNWVTHSDKRASFRKF